jgi:hypothetical protein
MAYDAMQEVRAMVLLSMPCPPMAMYMSRELQDEVSYVQEAVGNSHDLIAHLLNKAAAAQACKGLATNRRCSQQTASDLLNSRFDTWQSDNPSVESTPTATAYQFFAEFCRSYIQSFMADPKRELDIRFRPVEEVSKESVVHKRAVDFSKAQNILFGTLAGKEVAHMTYAEIIQQSARRILESKSSEEINHVEEID